ncbi:hypothetical protein VT84_23260 [Gemmata sp. SH-PL17]|uniref:hypothetical protein n=1 Tax=Gemmata sp. SH-PL17 TaxID=1630693 RepID=UPI00078C3952|nr:hypothetical protein [Gemmata sp. SH-PL17]AMV27338.1 hypothetical protein VT84_23260 [Gemmata sp. SH-PL17]
MPFRTTQPKLGLEVLEPREVPAVLTLYDEYLDPLSTAQAVSSPAPDGTGPRFEPQNVVTSTVPGTALTRNAEARIDRDVQPNGTVKVSARASVNPDYGKIFAFSTAGVTLRLIYRIDPSGGENIGDPVNIALALTGTTTSKNTGPDVGAAFLSGSASGDFVGDFVNPGTTVDSTWVLKGETIGSFVTLVIGARGQAIQSQGQPTILEAGATLRADLTIQPLARDVSPTSLAWDAVKGGVNLSYTNSEALPAPPAGQSWTYNLFWADRTGKKISAGLLGAGLAMDRGKGPHSEYVVSIGAPPPDATQLLYEVNSGGLAGENRSNNTRSIAYTPAISSFTAKYDGTGSADTVIGRFFSGSDPQLRFNPIDQTYAAVLSDSLAALKPRVTVSIGGQVFVATRQADGATYRTEPIDPGPFVGDKVIEVEATIGGASQGETWKGTLDTEPLPEWVSKLGEGKAPHLGALRERRVGVPDRGPTSGREHPGSARHPGRRVAGRGREPQEQGRRQTGC